MSQGHQASAGHGPGLSGGVVDPTPPPGPGGRVSYTQMLTGGRGTPNVNQAPPLKPGGGLSFTQLLMGEEETPGEDDIDIQYLLDALDRLEDASQAEN